MFTNGKIIESTRLNKGSHIHHKVVFTADQGIFKFQFLQYYWVVGTNAYALTFNCEQTQLANYQEIGVKIMNTFRLK